MSKTTCAVYTRISDVKGQPGIGVARQEKLCRELAEKRGWADVVVYSDDDTSAWTGKPRPGWDSLLQAVEAKEVQAVIAYEPSRLYRHPRDLEPLIALADKLSIDIATVMAGEIDLSTPQGRAIARTIVAWDSYESDVKSSRVKAQRVEAAKNGVWQGKPRYGYTLKDGKLVINPEEAEVVQRIVSEIIAGNSYRTIAHHLNEDGVPTITGEGKWGSSKVSSTFTPTVAGLYVHNGAVVGEGEWEPIVTRTDYESAIAVMESRKRNHTGVGPRAKYLLTGILKCGLCGEGMYYQKRGASTYAYKCNKQPDRGCGKVSISAKLDEEIAGWLTLILMTTKPKVEVTEQGESVDSIVAEIETLEARKDDLSNGYYVDKAISQRQFLTSQQYLEDKLTALRDKLASSSQVKKVISVDWMKEWDGMSVGDRRDVIGHYIESIAVNPGRRGTRGVDMSRLQVNWTNQEKSAPVS